MTDRTGGGVIPLALFGAAVLVVAASGGPAIAILLFGLPAGGALLVWSGRRPARAALILGVLVVAGGSLAATIRVVDRVADGRVEYRGELDGGELRRELAPSPGVERIEASALARMGSISSADATMSVPRAGAELTVLWVVAELAPWALAAYVLLLLIPLLRGAERGDPFWDDAATDLRQVGAVLLVGIPAIAVLRFVVGNMATSAVSFASPIADPRLLLTPWHVLPGLLVLVLASVFARGAELRDLDRHTV